MRTSRIIAAAVAAGVVGAGAVVTPVVLAADGDAGEDSTRTTYGRGWSDSDERGSWGYGDMRGPGGMGQDGRIGHGGRHGMGYGAMGDGGRLGPYGAGGVCDPVDGLVQGTLTAAQEQALADQAELEKLSHDVYLAFAESTGDPRFEQVAHAESRHLAALRSLLERYGLEDPTEGLTVGEFSSDQVAERYRTAVDAGSDSLADALDAARELERADLDGLSEAADGLDAPDVERVYEHLTASSERHLEVFSD